MAEADLILPHKNNFCRNDYWSSELSRLKQMSIDAAALWRDLGRPSHGPIFENKRRTYYNYKYSLRRHKRDRDQLRIDNLHDDLISNRADKFWHGWKNIHGSKSSDVTRINGVVDEEKIANEFAASFENVYQSNNVEAMSCLKCIIQEKYNVYCGLKNDESITDYFFNWENITVRKIFWRFGRCYIL